MTICFIIISWSAALDPKVRRRLYFFMVIRRHLLYGTVWHQFWQARIRSPARNCWSEGVAAADGSFLSCS